ncbi:DUF2007 domain-containing protein [Salmonella enterica subsp. enterica serovar Enteritidis]|nr:DUF2007 domain-containing protein [Salmonella enterica subsp. enterica serovar Enteritidis]ECG6590327.1 DUF2007 domain-containing protein [Salmonella enterica subsp. enterica serovar Newport]EDV0068820.1 DUF2007 domain-containing protein [Salmonella enterica subsp. enterica serovar Litchfield]EDV1958009.1 DUF2007 domain-containing protein [Salmonella enterica subsp. enterica serovar Litchfield]EGU1063020.1 DUF2007 domain-containing protein [Salmonella enterica subsp. enterica serovar Enterit
MWNIHPERGVFILLEQYLSPVEASIVAGRLESEGIAVMLLDEHVVWNNPLQAQAVGGVKLLVKQQDLDAARSVLNDIRQGAYCPETESESAWENNAPYNRRVWTVLSIVLMILFLLSSVMALLQTIKGWLSG